MFTLLFYLIKLQSISILFINSIFHWLLIELLQLIFQMKDILQNRLIFFLSYISSFNQFTQLRSLSLHYINSYKIVMNTINQCQHLENLTHLYFYYHYLSEEGSNCHLLINNVWSLPKLIQCRFSICSGLYRHFQMPIIISSSLESLSICSKLQTQFLT
jgi:hypothetical protein